MRNGNRFRTRYYHKSDRMKNVFIIYCSGELHRLPYKSSCGKHEIYDEIIHTRKPLLACCICKFNWRWNSSANMAPLLTFPVEKKWPTLDTIWASHLSVWPTVESYSFLEQLYVNTSGGRYVIEDFLFTFFYTIIRDCFSFIIIISLVFCFFFFFHSSLGVRCSSHESLCTHVYHYKIMPDKIRFFISGPMDRELDRRLNKKKKRTKETYEPDWRETFLRLAVN